MSDLEMTKLCAQAMGYHIRPEPSGKQYDSVLVKETVGHDPHPDVYDPLTDDAQAMALVKRFNMDCFIPPHVRERGYMEWVARCEMGERLFTASSVDLNRAIVECVAKMQAQR